MLNVSDSGGLVSGSVSSRFVSGAVSGRFVSGAVSGHFVPRARASDLVSRAHSSGLWLAPVLLTIEWHIRTLISQKQFNRLPKRWRVGGGGKPQLGRSVVLKM
jgi:hypothetical protein